MAVCRSLAGLLCVEREYSIPVLLHIHDGPAIHPGFVEALVKTTDRRLAIVSPFTLRVGVMDIETETRACAGGGPLEHLQIAIPVAERGDR